MRHGQVRDMDLDEKDFRILLSLQQDARVPLKELAKSAEVSIPTARSRLKRLKQMGIIRRFAVAVDFSKISGSVDAFVTIKARPSDLATLTHSLEDAVEVRDLYITTGEHDLIARISLPDMRALEDFVLKRLGSLPGIDSYRSSFIVEAAKESWGPTLRPGFGVKIPCRKCDKRILGEAVTGQLAGRTEYFCCQTCYSTFQEGKLQMSNSLSQGINSPSVVEEC